MSRYGFVRKFTLSPRKHSCGQGFGSLDFPRQRDVLDCVHATPADLPSRDFELRTALRQVQLLRVVVPCDNSQRLLKHSTPIPGKKNMRLRFLWTRPCVRGHVYRRHSPCESICNADYSGEDRVDHI